ncbi:ABC transporter ATP-binding protein [bacterium BMS3Abin03]|nr:ABC transporter ATP-binding protein [bacterium BMS3Abin03]MCG6961397.1 ABC transporter ATP-binding protein [bacterium BMS3Abin03]
MIAIETTSLSKVYVSSFGKKKVRALNELSLSINKGTIFGLLGPNGAGKTTLVKLLLQIIFPTFGSAKMLGENINNYKLKKSIGYLPENHKYPSYLNGGEVLRFFGKLSGIDGKELDKKIDELLEIVKLSKWKKTKIKAYSKGMMQRLGLAQALINDPELIFLDEPTDGVDPIGRKEIRDILVELKSRQKTIFLNSHLLSEVELITDRVGILNKGNLLREGTVKELTEKKEEYKLVIQKISESIELDNATKQSDNSYVIKVADIAELNRIIDNIRSKGILLKEIVPLKSTLEEMFISLINESEGTANE